MSKPVSQVVVRGADLSKARPPRWAWRNRIVLGSLNLLIGEEGVGKGTLAAWMIAQWTQGALPGALKGRRIDVGVVGSEDSWNDVWVPRLHAAGADLAHVHSIACEDGGYVDMQRDQKALKQAIRERRIRVLFLDQLLDNLGAGVDEWRQKAVRDALLPFRSIASKTHIAILASLHPNKKADTFRRMVAGSGAFNAVSRSSMLLAVHPDDRERRILVRGKGNLSIVPTPISFLLKSHKFKANGHTFSVPLASGFTRSELTAQDLVEATERPRVKPESKQDSCRALIAQLLPRDGKWHPCESIYEACREAELSDRTINRAKLDLYIQHRRVGSPPLVQWRWADRRTDSSTDARGGRL